MKREKARRAREIERDLYHKSKLYNHIINNAPIMHKHRIKLIDSFLVFEITLCLTMCYSCMRIWCCSVLRFVRVSCRLGTRLMDKWLKQCVKFVCIKLFDDFVLDLWTDVGLL